MILVKKILNSSVVLVDNDGQEMIALGKGIGYGKKNGDIISDSVVDKIFLPIEAKKSTHFAELVNEIPIKFFEITKEIVSLSETELSYQLNPSIYLTLSDHLHFAVERNEKGINTSNRLYWKIKNYYPKEYHVGEVALKQIKEKHSFNLPEEEASNIAFHLINAQSDIAEDQDGLRKAKLVGTIVNMVRYSIQHNLDTNSIHYTRFITHVRFFVDRFFSGGLIQEKEDELYRQMWSLYPAAMEVATKVKSYVDQAYNTKIPENEIVYLGVHINRLMNHTLLNKE
ncbi:transcription antiterminator BglG [Brochothrix thermosphacta]|uniref:PRD domain-containing protein n=1 Tax=Brochothrix thermosphacta TaxID=2756 RepID=UPI000E75202E|nr:PRD domain-containing protein [Brochothrix thermosphacta]ANZ94357.1 transcription antiterminator BglG [Brochothrix thermosphacta]